MKRGSYVRLEGALHVVQDYAVDKDWGPCALIKRVGDRSGARWLVCTWMTPATLQEAHAEIDERRGSGEWG